MRGVETRFSAGPPASAGDQIPDHRDEYSPTFRCLCERIRASMGRSTDRQADAFETAASLKRVRFEQSLVLRSVDQHHLNQIYGSPQTCAVLQAPGMQKSIPIFCSKF